MTHSLLHNLLATAEKLDGPQAWIHLCMTAADEAASAISELPSATRETRRWLNEPVIDHAARKVLEAAREHSASLPEQMRSDIYGGHNPYQTWAAVGVALEATWATVLPAGVADVLQKQPTTKPSQEAIAAAAAAYRANLPPITNRRSVQSFVACVAAGVLRGYITAKDANQLLYVAQVALSAFPKRTARKGGK